MRSWEDPSMSVIASLDDAAIGFGSGGKDFKTKPDKPV